MSLACDCMGSHDLVPGPAVVQPSRWLFPAGRSAYVLHVLPPSKVSCVLLYLSGDALQVGIRTVPQAGRHANVSIVALSWYQLLLCLLRTLHQHDVLPCQASFS